VDDVVADLMSQWLKVYNSDHDDKLEEKDITSWHIGTHTKIGDLMYSYLTPGLYDSIVPVKDSLLGVEKLRDLGYRVIFVTSFIHALAGRKYQWLQDYGFIHDIYDYVEARDKSLIKYDYLIDDNPENVINAADWSGMVFTRTWNIGLSGRIRFDNWQDVVSYFEGSRGDI
jgi:5'(3')-deoxyribonucleotidase